MDEEGKLAEGFDAAAVVAGGLDARRAGVGEEVGADVGDDLVGVEEEDLVGIGEGGADVVLEARAEFFGERAAIERGAELGDGRDAEGFVDPEDTLGVEAGEIAEGSELGRGGGAEGLELAEGSTEDDFADGAGDGFADAGELGEVDVAADQGVDGFAEVTDRVGGATVGADFERVFVLGGKELGERGEVMGDLGIAERSGGGGRGHAERFCNHEWTRRDTNGAVEVTRRGGDGTEKRGL